MNNLNSDVKVPLSPLWKMVDNKVVKWFDHQAEWIVPVASAGVYAMGAASLGQAAVAIIAGRIICIALRCLRHYAEVVRIRSGSHRLTSEEFKATIESPTITPEEKYKLATSLLQRIPNYNLNYISIRPLYSRHAYEGSFLFESISMIASLSNVTKMLFRLTYSAKVTSLAIEGLMAGKFNIVMGHYVAIEEDLSVSFYLFKQVSLSPDSSSALKADALYHLAYLKTWFSQVPPQWIENEIKPLKTQFDALSNKGNYEWEMNQLSNLNHDIYQKFYLLHERHPLIMMRQIGNSETMRLAIKNIPSICQECLANIASNGSYIGKKRLANY